MALWRHESHDSYAGRERPGSSAPPPSYCSRLGNNADSCRERWHLRKRRVLCVDGEQLLEVHLDFTSMRVCAELHDAAASALEHALHVSHFDDRYGMAAELQLR